MDFQHAEYVMEYIKLRVEEIYPPQEIESKGKNYKQILRKMRTADNYRSDVFVRKNFIHNTTSI